MQEKDHRESDVLSRAKKAIDGNDFSYARFLYSEALSVDPQNNAARSELYKMREAMPHDFSAMDKIKFAYHALKILLSKALANYDQIIGEAEKLLDIVPDSNFAMRSILQAASGARYYKLVIFAAEKIKESELNPEELILAAQAYLNEKIFDRATKIAKLAVEVDPENEEAKEVLWKSSVERHMNSDVQLVTADGDKRFVPPKVDKDKIFIASHKDDKDKGKGTKAGG
jgi:tetratricopeptide (TPR) repeat protein